VVLAVKARDCDDVPALVERLDAAAAAAADLGYLGRSSSSAARTEVEVTHCPQIEGTLSTALASPAA
jgi:hypothetical protein